MKKTVKKVVLSTAVAFTLGTAVLPTAMGQEAAITVEASSRQEVEDFVHRKSRNIVLWTGVSNTFNNRVVDRFTDYIIRRETRQLGFELD